MVVAASNPVHAFREVISEWKGKGLIKDTYMPFIKILLGGVKIVLVEYGLIFEDTEAPRPRRLRAL